MAIDIIIDFEDLEAQRIRLARVSITTINETSRGGGSKKKTSRKRRRIADHIGELEVRSTSYGWGNVELASFEELIFAVEGRKNLFALLPNIRTEMIPPASVPEELLYEVEPGISCATYCFHTRVPKSIRKLLKEKGARLPFPLIEHYERLIVESLYYGALQLQVSNPFHRLLIHATCQYYSLVSATVGTGSSPTMVICKPRTYSGRIPSSKFVDYLYMKYGKCFSY